MMRKFSWRWNIKHDILLTIFLFIDIFVFCLLFEESTVTQITRPHILCITKWVDYSNKYGFGFHLSDSSIGILFNDNTRMLLNSDGRYVESHLYVNLDYRHIGVFSHNMALISIIGKGYKLNSWYNLLLLRKWIEEIYYHVRDLYLSGRAISVCLFNYDFTFQICWVCLT